MELYEKKYIDFFDAIANLSQTLTKDPRPKIILNSLLISEIFNAYTRSEFKYWKRYIVPALPTHEKPSKKIEDLDYKTDYRKEDHFDKAVKTFTSDLLAHQDYIELYDDGANKLDVFSMLESFPANTDFNDYYYYLFCHEHNLSLVTNDSDFLYADIDIITNNGKLLKHK